MNKKGFSSLYIIMTLSSLVFLLLVVIEGTAGFALRSRAEGICTLAGESILSEYQPSLWARYGVFALRASDERLSALAEFYIGENLAVQGDNILRMESVLCRADSQEYPALDGERFAGQIRAAAAVLIAEDLLFQEESPSICSEVREALTLSEALSKDSEEEIQRIEEETKNSSGEADPGGAQAEAEKARLRALLKRYRSSGQPRENGTEWSKTLPSGAMCDDLPTRLLGFPGNRTLLSSAVLPQVSAVLENEYVVEKCSCATRALEGSALDLEAEYILFGLPSDRENYKEVRSSLFWLRSALNLSHIYGDPQKRNQVTALAASALAVIPLPAAVFLVAGIWAGVEAQNDVDLLLSGKNVPFIKLPQDWACSLDGAMRPDGVPLAGGGTTARTGSYKDYLRLLLLMVSPEKKRARLMDVMQLNIAALEQGSFCFRDYAYGFTLEVEFKKKMHLPGYRTADHRRGAVVQAHVYQ